MFPTKRKKSNSILFSGLIKKGVIGAFLLFFGSPLLFATPEFSKTQHNSQHHLTTHTKRTTDLRHHQQTNTHQRLTRHHSLHHYSVHQNQDVISPLFLSDSGIQLNSLQNSICQQATAELGKDYQQGGTSPSTGFDCSGFSQYVYKKEGFDIPRTALQQYHDLAHTTTPEPGDLVFFRMQGHTVSHVGIYLGNGYFIHSPAPDQSIRVDDLKNSYWKNHYAGARRLSSQDHLDDSFVKTEFADVSSNQNSTEAQSIID